MEKGIAAFVANAAGACRRMAQRLVDAKASALATRLDSLPARLFSLTEAARPTAAVVELGVFHLIAEAYRRQDALDPALREDVRQMVGWAQARRSARRPHCGTHGRALARDRDPRRGAARPAAPSGNLAVAGRGG
jgi:hypothetical protein